MPITLRVALATAVLSALVLGFFPGLDREVAHLFYDTQLNAFPVARTEWGKSLRWFGMYLPHLGWMVATAAIIVALLRPSQPMPMRPSIAIFLIVTALAIPALVVNAGFKQHWGRPRPVAVVEFGGRHDFRAWWDNSGACTRNCSFMSGETSAAAMLVGAATLAPLTIRPLAIGIAGLFTLLTGLMRVAFGGHWLSDILLGGSVSVLLLLAARHIILFARGIDDAEARLALSQTGFLLQASLLGVLRAFGVRTGRLVRTMRQAALSMQHQFMLASDILSPVLAGAGHFARVFHASAIELRNALFPARSPAPAPAE
ncbi:MAG: putative rane protein [Xanthobacteraceae bacterium]|jgi:membrane-associated phospholipid phosphatase|nr:putative rane protein [Xanthobacteraceae bacterium]